MEHIISTLFSARDAAHALHLKTRSFAAHMALGDLYDQLVGLADSLAEMHQGKHGIMMDISSLPETKFRTDDAVTFIRDLAVWAEASKQAFDPSDTHILNEWDNVIALIYKTKYKLENLV